MLDRSLVRLSVPGTVVTGLTFTTLGCMLVIVQSMKCVSGARLHLPIVCLSVSSIVVVLLDTRESPLVAIELFTPNIGCSPLSVL